MSLTLADQYFLKASDNYAYDVEQTVESLNYALSYDEMHPASNCLMGRLLMEKLKRFSEAKHCFEQALVEDPNYVDTYKFYSLLLIWMGELDKANSLIDKGMTKLGMPKLVMIKRKATVLEAKGKIKEAIKENKRGRLLSAGQFDYDYFNGEVKRLKQKCKKAKKGALPKKGEPTKLLLKSY